MYHAGGCINEHILKRTHFSNNYVIYCFVFQSSNIQDNMITFTQPSLIEKVVTR